jgi:type II secretion system protein I
MTRRKAHRNHAGHATGTEGFTIVEILVAMVILAVAVTALAALQTTNVRTTGFSKNASVAAGLAQARIEQLKNTTFNAIASGQDEPVQGMKVNWVVQVSGVTPNRFADVSVFVTWNESTAADWDLKTDNEKSKAGRIACYTVIAEP